jgi:hypothetical protein
MGLNPGTEHIYGAMDHLTVENGCKTYFMAEVHLNGAMAGNIMGTGTLDK